MKRIQTIAFITALGYFGLGTTQAAWTETFDSYTPGNINGNGPWVDWGGTLTPDVSTAQSVSGPNSLALSVNPGGVDNAYGSDVYATTLDPGGVVSSGVWTVSYQLYLESGFSGRAEMYISQIAMDGTGAGFVDGLWIRGTEAGTIDLANTAATANPALVYDAWTPVELVIDLGADIATASYNGTQFYSGVWDVGATGTTSIGGINFWGDGPTGAGGTYFVDDFSMQPVPEPTLMGLLGIGSLLVLRSRRRAA